MNKYQLMAVVRNHLSKGRDITAIALRMGIKVSRVAKMVAELKKGKR